MSTSTHFGPVLYHAACAQSVLPLNTSEQPCTASLLKKELISIAYLSDAEAQFEIITVNIVTQRAHF